jgi:hypothetical protein
MSVTLRNGSNGSEGGNSGTPSDVKKKRSPMGDRWIFVVNNYTSEDLDQWIKILSEGGWPSGFGREVGESGTPHLQGYIEFGKRVRPGEMKVFKELSKKFHWGDNKGRPCRGTRADNTKYIGKDGDVRFFNGLRLPRQLKLIDPSKPWQQDILKIISEEPDDRTIYWYWSHKGGVGKTSFAKYLVVKHGATLLSGKGADVRNGVLTYKQHTGEFPELCVYNIPREFNVDYLNGESLENIKDMCFYSGKYEGGSVCGPCPHLIIFANVPADECKFNWHFLKRIRCECVDEPETEKVFRSDPLPDRLKVGSVR